MLNLFFPLYYNSVLVLDYHAIVLIFITVHCPPLHTQYGRCCSIGSHDVVMIHPAFAVAPFMEGNLIRRGLSDLKRQARRILINLLIMLIFFPLLSNINKLQCCLLPCPPQFLSYFSYCT